MTDRDKLRERVADVIVKSWDEDEEYNSFKCADAAIALVLEEAARVAEAKSDEWTAEWRKGLKCDSHLEGMSDGADEIAAAIRAMIPHD